MKRSFRRSIGRFKRRDPRRKYGTVGGVRDKKRLKNNLRSLTLCISVVIIMLFIKSMDFSYAHRITGGVKSIITRKYDLKERFITLKDTIPGIRDKIIKLRGKGTSNGSMIMPVQGEITSGFGKRYHPVFNVESKHGGIDIAAAVGEPVRAALDGVVIEAGVRPDYGNVVIIEHRDSLKTLYGHLKDIKVVKGQEVYQGDTIGTVGNTGLSTGTHLHFEVWQNDKPVDPIHKLNPDLELF